MQRAALRGVMLRRTGTVTNAGAWYGPGSAKRHFASATRRIAPGTRKGPTMADSTDLLGTSSTLDSLSLKTKDLTASAGGFARAMTQAFSASVTGGKQFDDVLKSLALRISDLAVRLAFKPLEKSLTSGISSL